VSKRIVWLLGSGLAACLIAGLAVPTYAAPLTARADQAPAQATSASSIAQRALRKPLKDSRPKPRVPKLRWRDCGNGQQCTTAQVPLDYDRPYGRQITLSLRRLPATDGGNRIGSYFFNTGGPGQSPVTALRAAPTLLASAALRARFDIVAMDPRGVGESTPVRCFDTSEQSEAVGAFVFTAPDSRAQYRRKLAAARDLARRCLARNGDLLRHVSTANVARDLDLLRQAVGDRRMTFEGFSYGTVVAATYAALFPRNIRALVLDGNVDANRYSNGAGVTWIRARGDVGASATLREFFRLCAAAGSRCAFAAGGDPAAKFAQLVARIRRAPVTGSDGKRVDYGTLLSDTINGLFGAANWVRTAQTLQDLYTASFSSARPRPTAPQAPPSPPGYNNETEALAAILCGESPNARPSRYPGIAARAERRNPYGGTYNTWVSFPCAVWPVKDADRYRGSYRTTPAYPALVMNTRFDPQTPLPNARVNARLLRGSRLVIVEGWGHTVLGNSGPCDRRVHDRYLIDRVLPERGATCPAGAVPFT
jgi:pimeloyl-ACP methyl ester carboxylesterase